MNIIILINNILGTDDDTLLEGFLANEVWPQ